MKNGNAWEDTKRMKEEWISQNARDDGGKYTK